jgi:predicted nicotinamide N-methyase
MDDAFWDIQLNAGKEVYDTTWLAPQEREGLNVAAKNNSNFNSNPNDDKDEDGENMTIYEWNEIPLIVGGCHLEKFDVISTTKSPPSSILTLHIRSVKSNVSLMESDVGEEIWDAAKLFCAYLCQSSSDGFHNSTVRLPCMVNVKNKRILELGAGCGLLGMCCSILGASQVLCTDYLPQVMKNLAFNLKHNIDCVDEIKKSWIQCGVLDWKNFLGDDVKSAEWVMEGDKGNFNHGCCDCYSDNAATFDAEILIGSALVYSAQGAFCCADTIHYFFESQRTKKVRNLI